MTIDKAIIILEDLMTELPQAPPEERRQAVQLGIEALKLIKEYRSRTAYKGEWILPGETEG